jgi:nucleoid DNA-binding protein
MLSMSELSKEVYLRVDQEAAEGLPALTKNGMLEITRSTFDVIIQAIIAGESVMIPKFGKFYAVVKPARKGRNPKTGETIDISAKTVVKFRPSSAFKILAAEAKVEEKPEKKTEKKPSKKAAAKKGKKKN